MNKIQIFHGRAGDLSKFINAWLKTNKVGAIKFTTQSESQMSTGVPLVTISIWY
jgi:hypothetical protein